MTDAPEKRAHPRRNRLAAPPRRYMREKKVVPKGGAVRHALDEMFPLFRLGVAAGVYDEEHGAFQREQLRVLLHRKVKKGVRVRHAVGWAQTLARPAPVSRVTYRPTFGS